MQSQNYRLHHCGPWFEPQQDPICTKLLCSPYACVAFLLCSIDMKAGLNAGYRDSCCPGPGGRVNFVSSVFLVRLLGSDPLVLFIIKGTGVRIQGSSSLLMPLPESAVPDWQNRLWSSYWCLEIPDDESLVSGAFHNTGELLGLTVHTGDTGFWILSRWT